MKTLKPINLLNGKKNIENKMNVPNQLISICWCIPF